MYGRAEPRSVKGLVVALCSWCDGIIFCVVAYLWGQKVFRGFRIYGSKVQRFSYLWGSHPKGFRIF